MRVLGIETSCDECSLAIVDAGHSCVAMETYSQIDEHRKYRGVVPELASRLHVKYISYLYRILLQKHNIDEKTIDGIAVTHMPGLSGSLMVGLAFAKALSLRLKKSFIGINHIDAHFYSGRVHLQKCDFMEQKEDEIYPYIGMVVSGGHTILAIVKAYNDIEVKGVTIDDACGEVFDKVARELGLGYPGGAMLDSLAQQGCESAALFPVYAGDKNNKYNFSYSGLKTAVIHHRKKYWNSHYEETIPNISAAFSKAAIKMIVRRVMLLIEETGIHRVYFGGGVACNSYLRKCFNDVPFTVVFPSAELCSDNGAMIAGLGYWYLIQGKYSPYSLGINPRVTKYAKTNA